MAENRGRRPRAGVVILGDGAANPFPTSYEVWGSAVTVNSLNGVRCAPPTAQKFSTIFSTPDTTVLLILDHKKINILIPFALESIDVHMVMLYNVLVSETKFTIGK